MLEVVSPSAHPIIRVASLHAPHAGLVPDLAFDGTNVEGLRTIVRLAKAAN